MTPMPEREELARIIIDDRWQHQDDTAQAILDALPRLGWVQIVDVNEPTERPSWDEYFIAIARVVATRSDCRRDAVGALVVGADKRIRASGYNGAPAGKPGCESCPRRTSSVAPGSSYDNCVAVHAEANALLYCDRDDLPGATLYITRAPCYACTKLIAATGIVRVVTPEGEVAL